MRIKTYLNEGPGMFWKYQPGDRLAAGPTVTLADTTPADFPGLTPEQIDFEVADRVWIVGNKQVADHAGDWWPRTVRSLSVGDVLIIGEAAYAVASVGFEPVERFALDVSLSEYAKPNERLAEHRLARR
jgi:hypothetical protein